MTTDAPEDWYAEWVAVHLTMTGADKATAATLRAVRDTVLGDWRATPDELMACTRRLVSARRVPRWANEHTDAVGAELQALRAEEAAARRAPPEPAGPACDLCGGSGWVEVPARPCVWQGRIVCAPGSRGVYVASVVCDGCDAGRAVRAGEDRRVANAKEADLRRAPRRPTYGEYAAGFGGLDLAGMLREYRAEQARLARQARPPADEDAFAGLVASIRRKAGLE